MQLCQWEKVRGNCQGGSDKVYNESQKNPGFFPQKMNDK